MIIHIRMEIILSAVEPSGGTMQKAYVPRCVLPMNRPLIVHFVTRIFNSIYLADRLNPVLNYDLEF